MVLRRGWKIGRGQRIILVPGRIDPAKGQLMLVEAARILTNGGLRGVVFVLAGDNRQHFDYAKKIAEQAEAHGVAHLIRQIGVCPDMAGAYLATDFVAVPQIEPPAFPLAAAEAMAMARPVIATNVGAIPEIVLAPPHVLESARTGWLAEPDDPVSFARAIAAALATEAASLQCDRHARAPSRESVFHARRAPPLGGLEPLTRSLFEGGSNALTGRLRLRAIRTIKSVGDVNRSDHGAGRFGVKAAGAHGHEVDRVNSRATATRLPLDPGADPIEHTSSKTRPTGRSRRVRAAAHRACRRADAACRRGRRRRDRSRAHSPAQRASRDRRLERRPAGRARSRRRRRIRAARRREPQSGRDAALRVRAGAHRARAALRSRARAWPRRGVERLSRGADGARAAAHHLVQGFPRAERCSSGSTTA